MQFMQLCIYFTYIINCIAVVYIDHYCASQSLPGTVSKLKSKEQKLKYLRIMRQLVSILIIR